MWGPIASNGISEVQNKGVISSNSHKAVAAIENVKAIHPEHRYQPLSFQIVGRHRRLPEFLTRKPSFYNVEKRVAIFYLSSSAVTCCLSSGF